MKTVLKWIAGVLGAVVGIALLAALVGYGISEQRLNRSYEVAGKAVAIPADADSIDEGRRLTIVRGCVDCHGVDYGGATLIDEPTIGRIHGPNLTMGQGSATADFTAADWDRAIRHGIGSDGRPLSVMPSAEYTGLSDEDLGRIVAYLRSAPPVNRVGPANSLGPLSRVMLVTNQPPPLLAAEVIDHESQRPETVTVEASAAYGAYLTTTCRGCHGENLAGGPVPFSPPGQRPAANLTPAGDLAAWTLDDFRTTLRTGVTPEGRQLDPAAMPWPLASQMTDVELEAMWLYLNSLPPATPAN